jgi:hypothetical protein
MTDAKRNKRPSMKVYKNQVYNRAIDASRNSEGKFECVTCRRSYVHFKHLKRHERKHTGFRPFVCKLCRDTFCRSDILKRHYERCLAKLTTTGHLSNISRVPKWEAPTVHGQNMVNRERCLLYNPSHPPCSSASSTTLCSPSPQTLSPHIADSATKPPENNGQGVAVHYPDMMLTYAETPKHHFSGEVLIKREDSSPMVQSNSTNYTLGRPKQAIDGSPVKTGISTPVLQQISASTSSNYTLDPPKRQLEYGVVIKLEEPSPVQFQTNTSTYAQAPPTCLAYNPFSDDYSRFVPGTPPNQMVIAGNVFVTQFPVPFEYSPSVTSQVYSSPAVVSTRWYDSW